MSGVTVIKADGSRVELERVKRPFMDRLLIKLGVREAEFSIVQIKRHEPVLIEVTPQELARLSGHDLVLRDENGLIKPAPWNCMTPIKVVEEAL